MSNQQQESIAIGVNAGQLNQDNDCIAIGYQAAQTAQKRTIHCNW